MLKLECFFLPLFSFFIHIASASDSNSSSTICPTYSCDDGLQIRYPFWLLRGSPPDQYCGYQEFGLLCGDSYPIFSIHGLYYYVTNIDYDNHTLHLVDYDTFNRTCPRALHSVPLGNLPLSHSPLNLNLSFYYNCSSHPSGVSPIRCLTSGVNESFVFVMGNESTSGGFDWSKTCEESVVVTVRKDRTTSEGLMNEYKEAMNVGSVLDWQTAESCEECEASDGICGYSNTRKESLCFCKDGNVQSNSCSGRRKVLLSKLIIGLIAAGVGALLICITIFFSRQKISSLMISADFWKMKKNDEGVESFIRNNGPLTIKRYTYSEIKKMTNSFEVKLGEGGYGNVFRGSIANSCPVAVKVLKASEGNGEEFINEVLSISRTSHVNIVTFLGFCLEGSKRALVYELMPNGSLEKFISKRVLEPNYPPLSWEKLLQIAEGIAKGLEYLHGGCNTRIVHFDIKPTNILLDKNFCPKISDFGLAKLCSKTHSIVSMLGTRGTVGYIAPEVWNRNFGGVSHKSDVYSYGMLILEMVGGRQDINKEMSDSSDTYLPHLVYKQIELDKNITEHDDDMSREESEIAKKMMMVGLWCIQPMPSDRPPMNRVIEMLEGSLDQLSIPPKPFIFPPTIPTTGEENFATNGVLSFSADYPCGR